MIIFAIIIGLIIIGLIILINYLSRRNTDLDGGFCFGIFLTILCVIEISIVSDIIGEPKPKAMDVYQGKTTLEYTIRDGVKVDSVVVYKEE